MMIAALVVSTTAQAGLFSTVSGMAMDEVKPMSSYTIDTAGVNPRIYEFRPKNLKDVVCVVIFSSSDKSSTSSMECVRIK